MLVPPKSSPPSLSLSPNSPLPSPSPPTARVRPSPATPGTRGASERGCHAPHPSGPLQSSPEVCRTAQLLCQSKEFWGRGFWPHKALMGTGAPALPDPVTSKGECAFFPFFPATCWGRGWPLSPRIPFLAHLWHWRGPFAPFPQHASL